MYKVIKRLGYGGFGVVDLIEFNDGTQFAKKTFQPMNTNLDNNLLENVKKRFVREIQVQSNINHANIMPVLTSELSLNPPAYIMPLAILSLDKQIGVVRDTQIILKILLDILAGLEELHSLGIQHRDLKPQNILLLNDRYVISDFGLVSMKDTQISVLTQTGMRMGSDFYTAPEIVEELKNASNKSDIFSFGCILHDFFGTKSRIPCQTIYDENCIIDDIIEVCTRQEPLTRFQNVQDLREALVESLSISTTEVNVSRQGMDYKNYLKDNVYYDDSMLLKLFKYLESNEGTTDAYFIFSSINSDVIERILSYPQRAKEFTDLYSAWARQSLHDFNRCDVIAMHLESLHKEVHDLGTQSNILLALLIMGAKHNRWYVEEKFIKLVQLASFNLCRRFIIEANVIGDDVKRQFEHLEYSIGAQRQKLPQQLQQYLNRR